MRPLLLLSLLLLAGCATPTLVDGPPTLSFEMPAQGEVWRYREVEGYRAQELAEITYTVTRADAGGVDLAVEVSGQPQSALRSGQTERYAKPWEVIADSVYDRPITYETPLPLISGLGVGQRWNESSRARWRPLGRGEIWQTWGRWVGWEMVTVPAGTFRAARFERYIHFYNDDPFKFRTERRETIWYAPEVKHWVRREVIGTYTRLPQLRRRWADRINEGWTVWELLEYRPAP